MEGMKHYLHPTGFGAGLTAGVLYTVCSIFWAVSPEKLLMFFNDWFHGIDLMRIVAISQPTIRSYLRGLVEVMVFFYLAGMLYALFSNACVSHCRRRGWIK